MRSVYFCSCNDDGHLIFFSFLVGLDGRIYEGTGWHMRAHDTHASEYKEVDDFISICYIGDFAGT